MDSLENLVLGTKVWPIQKIQVSFFQTMKISKMTKTYQKPNFDEGA